MGILERIADIENEINRTQKNKGKLILTKTKILQS
jgi:ribosome-interacting GTPase 1